jgi:acyl-homoserine lactone acylase PvdQ
MGGGSELPFLPGFHSDRVYAGPVFRMIVDLSPHGRSVWSLDVGQCAHPMSRFYRDFFPVWKKVGHVPMAFRDEEVREATYSTLLLKPLA